MNNCQGALTNTIPSVGTCFADVRYSQREARSQLWRNPSQKRAQQLCAYCFLPHFEITVPLASPKLTDHLRKIEVNSKLNQKAGDLPCHWPCVARRRLAKPLMSAWMWRKRFTLCWPRADALGTLVHSPSQGRNRACLTSSPMSACDHTRSLPLSLLCAMCKLTLKTIPHKTLVRVTQDTQIEASALV